MAERLVSRLDTFSPALGSALIGVMGNGGPWMPGVVRALEAPGETKASVRRILRAALMSRPRADEPLPLLDELQIFGDGVDLHFPGTWPRAVGLREFLDRVNFVAAPSHHFVLDPCLADDDIPPIDCAPPAGPAHMVIDFVLMERGLGVRRFETVLLVTRDGGSCHGLSAHDEEFDRDLLDRIIDALADRPATAPSRRCAIQALAALGIPGFFDGYLNGLLEGPQTARDECLDYLLSGSVLRRFSVRLGAAREESAAAELLRALDRVSAGPSQRALIRAVRLLPDDCRRRALAAVDGPSDLVRALCESGWDDEERSAFVRDRLLSDDSAMRTAALHAALPVLHRSARVSETLLHVAARADRYDRRTGALLDRCIAAVGDRCGDEELARLIRAQAGVRGALSIAAVRGGKSCLAAITESLARGGDGCLALADALGELCDRLGLDPLEAVSSVGPSLPRIVAAGLELAHGPDHEARRAAAAELVEEIVNRGPFRNAAVRFICHAGADSIDDDLEPFFAALSRGRIDWPRGLRSAVIRSALDASRDDSTAAARLRLSLKDRFGSALDPLLDRALKNLSQARKLGSYRIDVRID